MKKDNLRLALIFVIVVAVALLTKYLLVELHIYDDYKIRPSSVPATIGLSSTQQDSADKVDSSYVKESEGIAISGYASIIFKNGVANKCIENPLANTGKYDLEFILEIEDESEFKEIWRSHRIQGGNSEIPNLEMDLRPGCYDGRLQIRAFHIDGKATTVTRLETKVYIE